jgi:hypothetical protein
LESAQVVTVYVEDPGKQELREGAEPNVYHIR